jgi:hypothetical protein
MEEAKAKGERRKDMKTVQIGVARSANTQAQDSKPRQGLKPRVLEAARNP